MIIQSSDEGEKLEEVKNFLNDLQSQGEEHYNNVISKLDSISSEIPDIKTVTTRSESRLMDLKVFLI
jgi:hypothetical protein